MIRKFISLVFAYISFCGFIGCVCIAGTLDEDLMTLTAAIKWFVIFVIVFAAGAGISFYTDRSKT